MRAFDHIPGRTTRGVTLSTLVTAAALVAGLAACGPDTVRHSQAAPAPGSRLIVRSRAVDAPVTATVEVTCESPITKVGQAAIGASSAQRFDVQAGPGQDWTHTLDVSPGSTCTATERPVAPATLRSVDGGQPVAENGTLTGVRTTIDAGATATVEIVAGAAP